MHNMKTKFEPYNSLLSVILGAIVRCSCMFSKSLLLYRLGFVQDTDTPMQYNSRQWHTYAI